MSASNLKSRAIRAGIWSAAVGFASTGLRFLSSLILTRLLFPEAFGIVAVATVVSLILSLLSDVGLKQFVIYRPMAVEQRYLDTIWSMSLAQGAIVGGATFLIGAAIGVGQWTHFFNPASVYAHHQLPWVVGLLGVNSLILGLQSPKLGVLERNLDLRSVAHVNILSQFATLVVTVGFAWVWRDVWAVVVGGYAGAITAVLLSVYWIKGPVIRFRWDRSVVKEVIFYGRWILLSSSAFALAANLDRLLLGAWVAPATLGIYVLALNIVSIVDGTVSRPFLTVAMPAFSEVLRQGKGKLKDVYLKMRLPFDLATVAAAGFLYSAAPRIIDILYDQRYSAAGESLRVLSFSLLFMRYIITATVHVSLGEPRTASIVNVIKLGAIAVVVPAGFALGGYEGALWGIAFHMLPSVIYLMAKNAKHDLNDFGFEAKMLLTWPAGYVIGVLFSIAAKHLLALVS